MTAPEMASVIMAIAAVLTAAVAMRRSRTQGKADEGTAAESVSRGAATLAESYQKRLNELEVDLRATRERLATLESRATTVEAELATWKAGVRVLTDQVRALGHEPAWTPPPPRRPSPTPGGAT